MDDQYLIATFAWTCPGQRPHRIILISDHGDLFTSAYDLVTILLAHGCHVTGQHKDHVSRELIDGMLAPELGL